LPGILSAGIQIADAKIFQRIFACAKQGVGKYVDLFI